MISSVYNYYMATYGVRPGDKHDTHKKNELRDVYNNIVRLNRSSPFYKIDTSESAQKRAIDLKESARNLLDITDDLSDAVKGDMSFSSEAESDNDEIVHAEYVGDDKASGTAGSFTISVSQLASPQVNTGNYLNPDARNLPSGTYSFDVDISSVTYELQFNIRDNERNSEVQDKIARLINRSNIGLKADIVNNSLGQQALRFTSNMTGVGEKPVIFDVRDDDDSPLKGIVGRLGLNNTTAYPSNAVFELNGETKVSSSNNFTVDREFELTLKGVNSDDDKVTISLRQNISSLIDSIESFADRYNSLASLAGRSSQFESHKLYDDLTRIADEYSDALVSSGLNVGEDGILSIDRTMLKKAADDGFSINRLSQLDKFKDAVQEKAHDVMINPMEYINKVIVSYKNPKRPTADPYMTSIYSGMMYNSYC